ncbi:PAS domain S-box protein [Hydrogenophaga sp.]|uniref:PAS domain S-box protein n=1 Tax=Hydrogenophaga sp. TaxID=1904254 RepID=UPI00271F3368|nr:PAS domain S-box protein [Hydrogenophaga sp.]MDO9438789.1 PAS domain S-box protein [Hydrogenophaga sp.]
MALNLDQFRAAFDQLDEAVEVIDPERMVYLHVNEACARLHGLAVDVMLQKGLSWVIARRNTLTQTELRECYQQLIRQQPLAMVQEQEMPCEDAASRWIEVKGRAIEVGGEWLIVVVSRDITQRREGERRLQLLNAVLNHSPDSTVVIDPQELEFLDVNEAAAQLHGHSRDEMMSLGLDRQRQMLGLWSQDELRQRYRLLIENYPRSSSEMFPWPGDKTIESNRRAVRLEEQWLIVSVLRDVTDRKAAEQRLQWLMAAIDQAADAILVVDPGTGEYLYVNDASVRLFGLAREVMMERGAMWVTRYLHIWTEEQQRAHYQQLIDWYPQPLSGLQRLQRAGRDPIWIETTGRALEMDGKWLIVTMARDITARRAAERKVQQLYAAVNQAPDAIMILDPEKLEFIDLNEGCARMYGLSRQELLRIGLRNFKDSGRLWSEQELRERYRKLIAQHPAPDTETGELHVPGRPRTFLETTRRAVKVEGRWVIITVARDVTARKGAEEQAHRLKAAIDQAVDAIFVIDPYTMTYVDANEAAARMYGTTLEQFVGADVEALATHLGLYPAGTMSDRLSALIAQAPEPTVEALTLKFPDGRRTVAETTRRAMQIDGKWMVLVISRDVTEREKASQALTAHAAELARSNRELEQFASVTSHDLSEPLRMVASFTQLLSRRYGAQLDEEGKEFMGYIVSGAQRMQQLIDDLLVYSRAGRAGAQMQSQSLDLALDDALKNLAHAARDSDALIVRATALPTLLYERTGMTQVFQNLVSNALKFKRADPPVVTISALRSEEHWTISVMDNGIGVDPDYFDRIFVIFQRLHSRERYEGTGIGLAICEKIVERHGGRIWAEAAPTGGACFKFTLPVPAARALQR